MTHKKAWFYKDAHLGPYVFYDIIYRYKGEIILTHFNL